MGKLILIRHGETSKNVAKSLHGLNDQESLNETGKKQIQKTAIKVAEYSPSFIYSSTEKRALESAEILSQQLNIPFRPIDGMYERNWGTFTGKPWDEVKAILDPMTLEERYLYVPPDGESWKTFEDRLIGAIKTITAKHPNETVIVVSHGGAIRALMPFLLGVPKEESFKYDPDNASLTIFDFDSNGFTEVLVNDTSHLADL